MEIKAKVPAILAGAAAGTPAEAREAAGVKSEALRRLEGLRQRGALESSRRKAAVDALPLKDLTFGSLRFDADPSCVAGFFAEPLCGPNFTFQQP